MLTRLQLEKYADVLLWALNTARGRRYRKNELVLIRFDLAAMALMEVLHSRVLKLGLHPLVRLTATPDMERAFYTLANAGQLTFLAPGEKELCRDLHGGIYLHAPASLTHLSRVDPRRIGQAAVARKPLRDILQERDDQGAFGWTLCALPTEAMAKQAGLTLKQYTRQIVKACYLDRKDPVGAWKSIHRDATRIKNWLNSLAVSRLEVESEHMDLRIRPGAHRKWVGLSGHNIPSFEIFLSPDWRGTQGVYYADQRSFRSGNLVEKVRIFFERGQAVKLEAGRGEDFATKQLAMDRGARRVGEFSLTDRRFSRIDRFMANTLYDENYGGRHGNCHLALGSSYSDSFDGDPAELTRDRKRRLGFNDSALHWDLVNTEPKTVTAWLKGGKRVVIYENGQFNC